jgi:hypothetical protein
MFFLTSPEKDGDAIRYSHEISLMKHLFFLLFAVMIWCAPLSARIFYVAADGNDGRNGTIDAPFNTLPKAVSMTIAGDTIYVRGGVYALTSTISIGTSKNGTEASPYYLLAFPGGRELYSNVVD